MTGLTNGPVLADWERQIRADPTRIRSLFPAAAREIARSPADLGTGPTPGPVRREDDVRALLLLALADALSGDSDRLVREVRDLYRFGDADERRAVLLALHRPGLGDPVGDRLGDLLHEALRTNDPRLVAAALGPYAAVLDPAAWRQGVLKCLFVGVPLVLVADVAQRTDDALVRMVAAYADERLAAGRTVSEDARCILATPTTTRES